jgi:hypothetical protein
MHAWQKQVQVTGRDIEKTAIFFLASLLMNTKIKTISQQK